MEKILRKQVEELAEWAMDCNMDDIDFRDAESELIRHYCADRDFEVSDDVLSLIAEKGYTKDFETWKKEWNEEPETRKINVLIVESGKEPRREVIEDTLETLHNIVGGYIETCSLYGDGTTFLLNEDGKYTCKPNRPVFNDDGELFDIFFGTFAVVGIGGENFESLTEEQFAKYEKMFKITECSWD